MSLPEPISVQSVRDYLMLETNNPSGASRYSDGTIGSNIRAASQMLEVATHRFFLDRPSRSLVFTTEGRAQLFIPGIRNVTSVTWQGGSITFGIPPTNTTASWFLPDVQQSGIYTGFQLRVFRESGGGASRWLANPMWFDQAMDSPYHPANRGGGILPHTLPNDLVITGDWGYATADLPEPYLHATKVLAIFYTQRPAAILANSMVTPGGTVIEYAHMPVEIAGPIAAFVNEFRLGDQAVLIQ